LHGGLDSPNQLERFEEIALKIICAAMAAKRLHRAAVGRNCPSGDSEAEWGDTDLASEAGASRERNRDCISRWRITIRPVPVIRRYVWQDGGLRLPPSLLSVGLAYCDGECPDSYRMDLRGNLNDLKALMRQNFMVWLIGHEIGHAIRHRDWAVSNATPLHFDLSYDWREAEADNFVGEAISKLPPPEAAFAPLLLEYADQEFVRLYNERQGHLEVPIPALEEPAAPLERFPERLTRGFP
jgi:hypothetical protein